MSFSLKRTLKAAEKVVKRVAPIAVTTVNPVLGASLAAAQKAYAQVKANKAMSKLPSVLDSVSDSGSSNTGVWAIANSGNVGNSGVATGVSQTSAPTNPELPSTLMLPPTVVVLIGLVIILILSRRK